MDNTYYKFDKEEIYKHMVDTQRTMMILTDIIISTWKEIEYTMQKKVKKDFIKDRRDPKEILRIAYAMKLRTASGELVKSLGRSNTIVEI